MNELTDNSEVAAAELDALKARADILGIKYHPAIGLDKLSAKVTAALEAKESEVEENTVAAKPKVVANKDLTESQKRKKIREEATKLQRVRIACMNPNKREWQGETFSVGNSLLGQIKKYVPYDTEWHVPQIILNAIKERTCQVFTTTTGPRGQKTRTGKLTTEFAIEHLPPLTGKELHDLAQRQAMANGSTEH